MENNTPEVADSEFETLFEEGQEGTEAVEVKSDQLSLEELNALAGRNFTSKEEFTKHFEGLKSLSGDQEAIKERKAQKELEKKVTEEASLKGELDQLKKDLSKKDFLIETPTAKQHIDILEAYAEKNGIALSEAWNSEAFKPIAEASQRASKQILTNNRITPVQAQTVNRLADEVKSTGSDDAKIQLVKEYLK